mmetsp:Transcript_9305/g.21870  ORF Transcript_9305/g.21870 Transcript_9305/m.21870 type:complete len:292 (-) Transcript_9305:577-1452(-)
MQDLNKQPRLTQLLEDLVGLARPLLCLVEDVDHLVDGAVDEERHALTLRVPHLLVEFLRLARRVQGLGPLAESSIHSREDVQQHLCLPTRITRPLHERGGGLRRLLGLVVVLVRELDVGDGVEHRSLSDEVVGLLVDLQGLLGHRQCLLRVPLGHQMVDDALHRCRLPLPVVHVLEAHQPGLRSLRCCVLVTLRGERTHQQHHGLCLALLAVAGLVQLHGLLSVGLHCLEVLQLLIQSCALAQLASLQLRHAQLLEKAPGHAAVLQCVAPLLGHTVGQRKPVKSLALSLLV